MKRTRASPADIRDVAADDTDVYWIEPPAIFGWTQSDTKMGPPRKVFAGNMPEQTPGVLVVDDAVYFTQPKAGRVTRAPKDGSMSGPVASNVQDPRFLALDSAHVYWTSASKIERAPRAGGATETLAAQEAEPTQIVVDGAVVYWISNAGVRLLAL